MGEETPERIEEICLFKMDTYLKHKKINDDKLYKEIPENKKQLFLDYFRKGKTVGESYELAGMTQEEGFVVLDYNIHKTYYLGSKPLELKEK